MSDKTPFEQWWRNVGSGIYPRADDDLESHIKNVAMNAWMSALMHVSATILSDDEPREDA